jgi:DNA-binding NtrC family response regulator
MVKNQIRHILAVDDEVGILSSIFRVLTKERYVVEAVSSPEEALAMIEDHRYDVFLCDMLMPRISGFELMRAVRNRDPGIPVVMMSGYSNVETMERCLSDGASCFLGKPFTPQELLATIKQAVTCDLNGQNNVMAGIEDDQRTVFCASGEALAG